MSMSEQDRREFLKRLAQAAAAAGVGAATYGLLEGSAEAAKKPRVVVVRGTDPARMLKSAMRVFRSLKKQVKGKNVVLKPNMSFRNPAAWGNNTSPLVAAAVAQLCRDWGAKKLSAVDHTLGGGARAMRVCGVQPALEKVGNIEIIAAQKRPEYTRRAVKRGKALKTTEISKVVAAGDLLVNIPVVKQHNATKISAGLKNLMGLIWDRRYFHSSINLHQGIADLATILTPGLTVIDATRVMVDNGPQGPGQVQKLNAMVVSTDPVAADAVAVGLTQWKRQRLAPKDVEHIKMAAALGLGVADLSKIKIIKKRV
jgi:uncharacterized protein (DUF362 family)